MPSRKKRKRYRQQLAEATAPAPFKTRGGFGEGCEMRRSDWRLVRGAIYRGWPIPDSVRSQIMDRLGESFDDDSPRMGIAVVRTVLAMEEANQAAQFAAIRAGLSGGINYQLGPWDTYTPRPGRLPDRFIA